MCIHSPVSGVVPRNFLGVLTSPLATALAVMAALGRVDWPEPWLAVWRVRVAPVPMAIGSALGDLLAG